MDEIWDEFANCNVERVDGVQMTYWVGGTPPHRIAAMLADPGGDGSCIPWAQLLHWCLESQGLGASSQIFKVVTDTAVNPDSDRFLVKNWNFDRHIRTGPNGLRDSAVVPDDAPEAPAGADTPCILPGPNGVLNSTTGGDDTYQDGLHAGTYPYEIDADVRDQTGVEAQGNTDPRGHFANHWVCKISGSLYDPSYGIGGYATENLYENAAIDGIIDTGPDPDRCKKNDAGTQELKFTQDIPKE